MKRSNLLLAAVGGSAVLAVAGVALGVNAANDPRAGAVSHRLVHEVRPGELLWLGPPGHTGLSLDAARSDDLLLVAGGTGLAPLRALVEQVAAAPDGRRVTLVVGARSFTDLYDAISLDKLQCAHEWLTVVPTFSDDPCAEAAEQGDALTVALEHHRPGPARPGPARTSTSAARPRCWLPPGHGWVLPISRPLVSTCPPRHPEDVHWESTASTAVTSNVDVYVRALTEE
ncbi:hypothetical protein [Micromonospora sp. B9E7]|uniref:hypothetical protein n=1 Tax=Micromonospora sp. B9E7 TaxID=3153574 RepID=UPI00325D7184